MPAYVLAALAAAGGAAFALVMPPTLELLQTKYMASDAASQRLPLLSLLVALLSSLDSKVPPQCIF